MDQNLYQQKIFNIASKISSINTEETRTGKDIYALCGSIQNLNEIQKILMSLGIPQHYMNLKDFYNNYGVLNVQYRTWAWADPKKTLEHVQILNLISKQFRRLRALERLQRDGGITISALEAQYIAAQKQK